MKQNVSSATKILAAQYGLMDVIGSQSEHVGWREGEGLPLFVVESIKTPNLTGTLESAAQIRIMDNIANDQYSLWFCKTTIEAIKAVSNPQFRQVAFLDFYAHIQDQNPLRAALIQHRNRNTYFNELGRQLLADRGLLKDWVEHRMPEFSCEKGRVEISENLALHGMHLIDKGLTPNTEMLVKKFIENLPHYSLDDIEEYSKNFSELLAETGFQIKWEDIGKAYPASFTIDIDNESDRNLLNTPELIPDELLDIESENEPFDESYEAMQRYCDELANIGYIADYDLSGELVFVVKATDLELEDVDLEKHSYLLTPGEHELLSRKASSFSPN